MKMLGFLIKKSPNRVFISIFLGGLAGLAYAMLFPTILTALKTEQSGLQFAESHQEFFLFFEVSNYPFAALFAGICLFILIFRSISQAVMARLVYDATSDLRINVYDHIIKSPILNLEKIGPARLMAALTTDVPRVIAGASILPGLLTNSVTLTGMLGYLLYLNTEVFQLVIGAVLFGIITYQIPNYIARYFFKQSREYTDDMHESIRGLIYGVKELKQSQTKREAFFNELLLQSEKDVISTGKRAVTTNIIAENYGGLINFFVIGVVSFVFINYNSITQTELVGVIMALLYVSGPIVALLNLVPRYIASKISYTKLNKLLSFLSFEEASDQLGKPVKWDKLRLSKVLFKYPTQDNEAFEVGPFDLEINKGETTFIIGGNGSGKSTLSKLLTLHYSPSEGEIYFGDERIDANNINTYRQCISSIYSDYYLFDRLLGEEDAQLQSKVDEYLKELELDKKVSYQGGRFSSLNLSDGQKRRLALLVTFVENKEIYLFDEWAADQDPLFKKIFYYRILPELKQKNKAVIVVTHDDRYFKVADKFIVMEDGKFISSSPDSIFNHGDKDENLLHQQKAMKTESK